MKIFKQTSTNGALAPGEIEVHIFSDKAIACGKTSHAALRYCLASGDEHYVSIYPREKSHNGLACLPVKFRTKRDDFDSYLSSAHDPRRDITPVTHYKASVYRFSGDDIYVSHLHQELSRLQEIRLGSNAQKFNYDAGYNVPTTGDDNTDQFFKMFACLSFAACCTNPPFPSLPGCAPRHNCTSIVVHLLGKAGIATDLSTKWVWLRFLSQILLAGSIGYSAEEGIRIYSDPQPADEILGIITAAIGCAGVISYIASNCGLNLLAKCFSPEILLTQQARFSMALGLFVFALATGTLLGHSLTTTDPFNKSDGRDYLVGVAEGVAVAVGLFVLSQILGLCKDWHNGCSNPYG